MYFFQNFRQKELSFWSSPTVHIAHVFIAQLFKWPFWMSSGDSNIVNCVQSKQQSSHFWVEAGSWFCCSSSTGHQVLQSKSPSTPDHGHILMRICYLVLVCCVNCTNRPPNRWSREPRRIISGLFPAELCWDLQSIIPTGPSLAELHSCCRRKSYGTPHLTCCYCKQIKLPFVCCCIVCSHKSIYTNRDGGQFQLQWPEDTIYHSASELVKCEVE